MSSLLVYTILSQEQWYDDNVQEVGIFEIDKHKYWLSERPDYHSHGVYASVEAAMKACDERLRHRNVVGAGQWKKHGHNGISLEHGIEASRWLRDVIWVDHLTGEFQSYWQWVELEEVQS